MWWNKLKMKENKSKFRLNDIKFNWNEVYSNDEMEELKNKIKSNSLTIGDLELATKYNIANFYNSYLENNFRDDPDSTSDCIYDKQYIEKKVKECRTEEKGMEYLSVLVSCGIITSYGSSYIFDNGQIIISEDEWEEATDTLWKIFCSS